MEAKEDQIYIERVLQGDSNAFAFLINRYKDMVFTLVIKIVKSREDAEEVAQDSFIKAYQKLDSFKGQSKFSTWLYTIAYRNALTKVRKKKLETTDIDSYVLDNHKDGQDFPQIEAIKNNEQEKYVKQAIENLGETDCLLITLFYLNDNSIEEIQEITEMSQSNVKVRLFRARKRLYKELSLLLKEEIKTIL
jgi:RNA polymerase sigma-70 factor (ECF subfamily)